MEDIERGSGQEMMRGNIVPHSTSLICIVDAMHMQQVTQSAQ